MSTDNIIRHLLLPLQAPALIVALYLTPKHVFGCANRGLMALAVVTVALAAAVCTASRAVNRRRRGDPGAASWWMVSTLILLLPLLLLVGPLG